MENIGKSYVEFDANGEDFHFVFEDGGKSFNYSDRFIGLRALVNLTKDGKVKLPDFWEMREALLPNGIISRIGERGGILAICIGPTFIHPLKEGSMEVVECFDYEDVETAAFKYCDCGDIHGQVFFKGGFTDLSDNKEELLGYLKYLRTFGYISDGELLKVGEEVENSLL